MHGFLDPNKVLGEIELRDDMTAAEFGCGAGGFTIPLAKRLEGGRVYGIDIQPEALSVLKSRAEMEGLTNIETRLCNLEEGESTRLKSESLDLVMVPNVLFQVQDKEQVLREATRILRQGGSILVVDWLPQTPFGPKKERVSPEALKKIAEKLKLKLEKEFQTGEYHYGLVFSK